MLARTENPLSFRPRMVLAYADSARAALNSRQLRRMGWEVHQACSGPEARRLVYALRPQVVILDAELRGESGWLTCAKLTKERPGGRVVLIADDNGEGCRERGTFVGASAVVGRQGGLNALMQASWLPPSSAAG
jgi:CheY-like chemotaxis protein